MEIINKLEIINYRSIKHLIINSKSINILIGRNNTGKTSVLEAIYLLLTSHNEFNDYNNFITYLFETKNYNFNYLIHKHETDCIIKSRLQNYSELEVSLDYFDKGFPDDIRGELIINYFTELIKNKYMYPVSLDNILNKLKYILQSEFPDEKIKIDNVILKTKKELLQDVFSEYFDKDYRLYIPKIINQVDKLNKIIVSSSIDNLRTSLYLILPMKSYFSPILSEIFSSSQLHGVRIYDIKKDHIIDIPVLFNYHNMTDALSLNYLYDIAIQKGILTEILIELRSQRILKDIRKTDRGFMIFIEDHEFSYPLASMGNGFVSLIKLIFMSFIAKYGVILLDEPENSLHPRYLDVLSKSIVETSEHVQYFMATHNIDLINDILKWAKRLNKLNDVNIIILNYEYDHNNIISEEISGIDALDEIETIGIDFRLV